MVDLKKLTTERRNPKTKAIDRQDALGIAKLINEQDQTVAVSVGKALAEIAQAIDLAVAVLKNGGRVIYFGAGTSGRLGFLDASEILPTFGEGGWFKPIIAGGKKAVFRPVENAEDDTVAAAKAFQAAQASKKDLFIGISASGRTPFVVAGIKYAQSIGAATVSIATARNAESSGLADIGIEVVTGPEAVTGSTRLKSGTAQKMVLNILSTAIGIKMGKVYSNLLVDMKPTNEKLRARAIGIIAEIAKVDSIKAEAVFEAAGRDIKTAIVMQKIGLDRRAAKKVLSANGHLLFKVLEKTL